MNMANRLNQLVLALAAIACATAPADAAIFGNYKVKGESTGILMGGEIVPGDAAKFEAFINQMPRAPTAVALDSPGGRIDEALQIAAIVKRLKVLVVVGDKEGTPRICASACFYIFAAGASRSVIGPARVGLHSNSVGGVETSDATASTIFAMRWLKRELNVPDVILAKMALTAPDGIAWLTPGDIVALPNTEFKVRCDGEPGKPPGMCTFIDDHTAGQPPKPGVYPLVVPAFVQPAASPNRGRF